MRFAWPVEIEVDGKRIPPWNPPGTMLLPIRGIEALIDEEIPAGDLLPVVWPGEKSGITIGVGYDLGRHRIATVRHDWAALGEPTLRRFEPAVGIRGDAARRFLEGLADIAIARALAVDVFRRRSLPVAVAATLAIYPRAGELWPAAQAALVSLVYNRGNSLEGERRREMRAIRSALAGRNIGVAEIVQALRAMKRLWPKSKGLRARRDREAAMVDSAPFEKYGHDDLEVVP